jgi:Uma2 family endonuclease
MTMSNRPNPPADATSAVLSRPPLEAASSIGGVLTLRFGPRARLTDRLFSAIAIENDELRVERTAAGDLEIMSPAGSGASHRNSSITFQLVQWANGVGRGLGLCFDSSGGFVLPNGAIRSPDASWVAQARWDALTPAERATFAPLCPDFVVELRSHTDRIGKLREKMREYMSQGARLGWLIDPLTGRVEIYRQGRPVETLLRPDRLSGEAVLPGFVLELEGIIEG